MLWKTWGPVLAKAIPASEVAFRVQGLDALIIGGHQQPQGLSVVAVQRRDQLLKNLPAHRFLLGATYGNGLFENATEEQDQQKR